MKKALLVLLALTMIGAVSFADVKVSGILVTGVKAGASIVGSTTTDYIKLYEGFRGFDAIATIAMSVTAGDGAFGYDTRALTIPVLALAPTVDLYAGWWKMFDGIATLSIGGLIPNSFATAEMAWGDSQFNGVSANLTLKPIEGLEIGYSLPLTAAGTTLQAAFQGSKIGASYSMKDTFAVNGAYLMSATANAADAYVGLSVSAIQSLGLYVEALLLNIGDAALGSTDVYAEIAYNLGVVSVDLWGEVCLPAASGALMGWVVGPSVTYPLMENVALTGEFDIGNNDNLGGWYGMTSMGAGTNLMSWAITATCDYASPAGKIRLRAGYQSLTTANNSADRKSVV